MNRSNTHSIPTSSAPLTSAIGPLVRAVGDAAGDVAQLTRHPRSPGVYRALHADLAEVAARALAMMDTIEPNAVYSRDLVEAKRLRFASTTASTSSTTGSVITQGMP